MLKFESLCQKFVVDNYIYSSQSMVCIQLDEVRIPND